MSEPLETIDNQAATASPPNRQVVTVHLRNIPLLAGLDTEVLAKVGRELRFRTFDRGAYVAHKGSAGEHLLFVLSGRLKILELTDDGREVGLSFMVPGDYAGELSVIDGLGRSASLVASEPSLIGFLPRASALALIYSTPLVTERILKRMATKIRLATDHRALLSIPSAHQRIYALLHQLARTNEAGEVHIVNLPTQQELAVMVNTARETVSRAVQTLIQKGVVAKSGRNLIIRDAGELRQLAFEDRNAAPIQVESL